MTRFLVDPRDASHLRLILFSSLFIPAGAFLFYLGSFPWWAAAAYLVAWAFFSERFTMMFHCTIHRRLFQRRYWYLDIYLSWALCPFFGQTPGSFYIHHMGMHHVDNNLPEDLSSTMRYQRDNVFHFLHYFLRFFFLIPIELTLYFRRSNNKPLVRRFLTGELAFHALCACLALISLQATLIVFVIPFCFVRLMMMIGNWAQHAFVDPDEPDNDYKSSVNSLAKSFNERCCNAGYHIYHHVRKGAHFSELALEFERNRATYGHEDAIVFDRLDLCSIWFLLLARRHATLAKYFVRLPGAPTRTDEEVVALFKRRLAPIRDWTPPSKAGARRASFVPMN